MVGCRDARRNTLDGFQSRYFMVESNTDSEISLAPRFSGGKCAKHVANRFNGLPHRQNC